MRYVTVDNFTDVVTELAKRIKALDTKVEAVGVMLKSKDNKPTVKKAGAKVKKTT